MNPIASFATAGLDHRVADHHLDHAGLYDVHARARILLAEHDASSRVAHARSRPLGKHAHVDLVAVHFILVAQGTPRAASLCQKFPPLRQLSLNHRLDYPLAQQCGQRARRAAGASGRTSDGPDGRPCDVAAALWLWPAVDAGADAWPGRQVKIVVAFAPGGSADQFGRLLAAELSAAFRQQFFVENRPGNSGAIGSAQVARVGARRLYLADRRFRPAPHRSRDQSEYRL